MSPPGSQPKRCRCLERYAGATQAGKTTREDKTRHGEKADGNDPREPGQPARDKARYRQRTVIPQKTGQKRANSVLRIGPFRFPGAFIQQLENGRWHVMRRTSRPRYPIEVVSIPLAAPLTTAFKDELPKLMESDMPKELRASLKNQLRLILKR